MSAATANSAIAEDILVITGLTKRFGGLVAVDSVDMFVPRGSIAGLIGPNGAGKTTIFNMIAGIYQPSEGAITFDGAPLVSDGSQGGRSSWLRPDQVTARGIARTFQNIRLFANMSALDNVLIGMHSRLKSTPLGAVLRLPSVNREGHRERRASRAGSGHFFELELVAVPPQHSGAKVDDEPPARRVTRVAADRPWVGQAGAGRGPVVRLARDRQHCARSDAVVGEERRFMRVAGESEGARAAAGQDARGGCFGEKPEQGVARRAVPAVDAVTAGHCAARQPEYVASAGDDPVWSERPGVVVPRDQ